jgi:hypothetical protein
MDAKTVVQLVALSLVFGTGVVIALGAGWLEYRKRIRAIDVLRIYAERGEEAPASVADALAALVSGHKPGTGAASAPTRAHHMAYLAANIVALLGSAGIAWWRLPNQGEPGRLVIFAVIAAIFFAMASAAYLMSVFTTPPKPHFENDRAHVAANIVGMLGSVWLAWWRMPGEGEPGALVIWAVIAAVFFAAMLVLRLVTVFATPGGGRPRDDR